MAGRLEFDVRFRAGARKARERDPEAPFRIVICGDFSGRAARGVVEAGDSLAMRPFSPPIDVDNFDRAMRRLGARLPIFVSEQSTTTAELAIESLDDFHPDKLCSRIASLQLLCELRRRLIDPRTAPDAIRALTRDGTRAGNPEPSPAPSAPTEDDASMLTRLLGSPARSAPAVAPLSSPVAGVDEILRRAVAGHVSPAPDPRQENFVASVDQALGASVRRLLHDPSFQQLEAGWRSLHWLVTNLGADEELQIVVLDVSKQELAEDLLKANSLDESATSRRLTDAPPWSLLVGDYSFGPEEEDVTLLAALAALGKAAGAPFMGAANADLVGCRVPRDCSSVSSWTSVDAPRTTLFRTLRRSGSASFAGLTWPRWLSRSPYGAKRDPVESFAFEELDGSPVHSSLLWGNGAFLAAAFMASAARDDDEGVDLEGSFEVGDLPLYVYDEDGESKMQPCAECWLTDEAIQATLERGIMPIWSLRGRNTVRLVRLQSIADPPSRLAGSH